MARPGARLLDWLGKVVAREGASKRWPRVTTNVAAESYILITALAKASLVINLCVARLVRSWTSGCTTRVAGGSVPPGAAARSSCQEHRQPLRRAGNAADGRSRLRAGLARGIGLVHDNCFWRIATNIAVLVDAGSKVDDLRQLVCHAGLRDISGWVAPVGYKWPEPFQAATSKPTVGGVSDGIERFWQ